MVMLSVASYEQGAAKWFNDRGIAAFVLKYRVLPSVWQTKRGMPNITKYPKGNANPLPEVAPRPSFTSTIRSALVFSRGHRRWLQRAHEWMTKRGVVPSPTAAK